MVVPIPTLAVCLSIVIAPESFANVVAFVLWTPILSLLLLPSY